MPNVSDLADKTEETLNFLASAGSQIRGRMMIHPDSFKGGFAITYQRGSTELVAEYLDAEFSRRLNQRELFGASSHPGFAGNMFSREHLAEYLPRIAEIIKNQIA